MITRLFILFSFVLILASAHPLLACTTCFGSASGKEAEAIKSSMLGLLAFVVFMQISFGAFFIHLWRKNKQAALAMKAADLETETLIKDKAS